MNQMPRHVRCGRKGLFLMHLSNSQPKKEVMLCDLPSLLLETRGQGTVPRDLVPVLLPSLPPSLLLPCRLLLLLPLAVRGGK
jgi:hypothetical protein